MRKPIRVMLTGSLGQLGHAIRLLCPLEVHGQPVELVATARLPRSDMFRLDLEDPVACYRAVQELRPDWIINAGAYTAVDRAESDQERAIAVNANAPRAFAESLQNLGHGKLLQISTDFVFDGGQGHPYRPHQPTQPLGVYGTSKAMGEQAVQDLLDPGRRLILRTSWVYGSFGHNFLLTMLHLHRQRSVAGQVLEVVADQVGCPTNTTGLAQACWRAIYSCDQAVFPGVLHWCDAGVASWYDFSVAIGDLGVITGQLERAAQVLPISTIAYPTPAPRPAYSLLDCEETRAFLGLQAPHWRSALKEVLIQLGHSHTSQE